MGDIDWWLEHLISGAPPGRTSSWMTGSGGQTREQMCDTERLYKDLSFTICRGPFGVTWTHTPPLQRKIKATYKNFRYDFLFWLKAKHKNIFLLWFSFHFLIFNSYKRLWHLTYCNITYLDQGEPGPTGVRGGPGQQGPRGDGGHVGPPGPTGKEVGVDSEFFSETKEGLGQQWLCYPSNTWTNEDWMLCCFSIGNRGGWRSSRCCWPDCKSCLF